MREIKFRAWNGEYMIYPEDSKHDTVKTASAHILKHYDNIMQYTGLKDRNGVEIYEGDVVDDEGQVRIVKWSKQNSQFYLSHSVSGKSFYKEFIQCGQYQIEEEPVVCSTISVIGNIHTKTDSNVQS